MDLGNVRAAEARSKEVWFLGVGTAASCSLDHSIAVVVFQTNRSNGRKWGQLGGELAARPAKKDLIQC